MAQQFMSKLSPNERMALWGSLIVFVLSLIGTSWFTLILSAGVIVVLYLKHSPTSNITWPVPPELINVVLSVILGILALFGLLAFLGLGGLVGGFGFGVFGGLYVVVLLLAIVNAVGAGMMVLGTWREYQAAPKSAPPPPPPPAA